MASISKRIGKKGTSYLIRVSNGFDANKKPVTRARTWKPEPGMTQKQEEKALNAEVAIFENDVKAGLVSKSRITFKDFAADKWMREYAEKQLAPSTVERYKSLLERIYPIIGHIKLAKIRPGHINEVFNALGQKGMNMRAKSAVAKVNLAALIKEQKTTRKAVAESADLSISTVYAACKGNNISVHSGEAISKALNLKLNEVFQVTGRKRLCPIIRFRHYHDAISIVLQTAVYWGIIAQNPAERVKPPKVERKEALCLQDTDIPIVLAALKKEPIKWRAIVLLLLVSGIRRGELCGLEWKVIDFKNKLIDIRRTSQYVSGMGIIEKGPKTRSSNRVMKLPDTIFELLKEYKHWQNKERLKLGDQWLRLVPIKHADGSVEKRKNDRVFTQENGSPIFPDSVTSWTKKFCRCNDLPLFTPHVLRHSNVSLQIANGVPLRTVSQRAGHSQLSTTTDIYAHAIKTRDAMAADVMGDLIKGI